MEGAVKLRCCLTSIAIYTTVARGALYVHDVVCLRARGLRARAVYVRAWCSCVRGVRGARRAQRACSITCASLRDPDPTLILILILILTLP